MLVSFEKVAVFVLGRHCITLHDTGFIAD